MKKVAPIFWIVCWGFFFSASPCFCASATDYIGKVMNQFHKSFNVYTDTYAAGNHFVEKGRMSSPGDEDAIPAMEECSKEKVHTGLTAIKCRFFAKDLTRQKDNWGGWYFMNGVMEGEEIEPRSKLNWGDYPNAGINLTGAGEVSFYVYGTEDGQIVEFFCGGMGYKEGTGPQEQPYPDSFKKRRVKIKLEKGKWKKASINVLSNDDLSYVIGGFGWVASAKDNNFKDITFYLDDIKWNFNRLQEDRFIVSYKTIRSNNDFDVVMRNVAFTYDNAVALLALLASGKKDYAKKLADALCYAWKNDRFYRPAKEFHGYPLAGWLRNAYQGGDLKLFPGWVTHGYLNMSPYGYKDTTRLPGWWDCAAAHWYEDQFQVSTHTGNLAWAMLALLGYYESQGGAKYPANAKYLSTAKEMGIWVENYLRDNSETGGYFGGFDGWEPNPAKLTYKATEHNIDLYAAFRRLYLLNPAESFWNEQADHAKKFINSMWNGAQCHFWTGTDAKGVRNESVIPLDIQPWANLAFKDQEGQNFRCALDYAETHHKKVCGYDFNTDLDGIWHEGTAQMAVAYFLSGRAGDSAKYKKIMACLKKAQKSDGSLPAASIDGLTTGFDVTPGVPWLYYKRAHVGATAWYVLAEKKVNPFWYPAK